MESLNGCAKTYHTCLDYDQTNNQLIYTTNLGQTKVVNLNPDTTNANVSATLGADCVLTVRVNGSVTDTVDLTPILDKITDNNTFGDLKWFPGPCQLLWTSPSGDAETFDLSVIVDKIQMPRLDYDANNCLLKWISGDGSVDCFDLTSIVAKTAAYTLDYNPNTHTVSLINTNTGSAVAVEQLNCGSIAYDATTCRLSYTDEKGVTTTMALPRAVTDLDFNGQTRQITVTKCDGTTEVLSLGSDSFTQDVANGTITHTALDGTSVIVDICQLAAKCKPTMNCNVDATGNQTVIFNDGYGGIKTFDIPAVVIDSDQLTVNGSVVTFTGDNGTVIFDVCGMVASNCNARFTAINPDGSWSFTDNAGNVYNWAPPVEKVTVLVDNGDTFTYTNEAGQAVTIDKCCTNVTQDADNYYVTDHNGNIAPICKRPVKDAFFNGTSIQPDANGTVVINYAAPVPAEGCCHYQYEVDTSINIDNPPTNPQQTPAQKNVGDTVHVKHNNGQCFYTCAAAGWVLNFCCIDKYSVITQDADNWYVTDPDGNVATICKRPVKAVQCQDAEGNWQDAQFFPSGLVRVPYKAPIITKEQIDPLVDPNCRSGGCFEVCGQKVGIRTNRGAGVWNPGNSVSFLSDGGENTVALGDVIEAPNELKFTTPDCIGNNTWIAIHATLEMNQRNQTAGIIAIGNQVSLDGGATWVAVQSGGHVFGPDPTGSTQTDFENGGVVYLRLEPCTDYCIKWRAVVNVLNGFVGEITLNQFEVDYAYYTLTCIVEECA